MNAAWPALASAAREFGLPLLDLVFPLPDPLPLCHRLEPPFCARCAHPFDGQICRPFRCANCGGRPCHYDSARAQFLNRGPVRAAIHAFKYDRAFWLRRRLGAWLVEGFDRFHRARDFDAIVPVPLHPARLRWREFNQATELSRWLSRHSGLPVHPWLRRIRHTRVQATLTRAERRANILGAFGLAPDADCRDTRALLVDDVFTTGSTVNECARLLKRAGAASVHVLAVARG